MRRPDGSLVSLGYGKDSLVIGLEKVFRCVLGLAAANDLAGSYADTLVREDGVWKFSNRVATQAAAAASK